MSRPTNRRLGNGDREEKAASVFSTSKFPLHKSHCYKVLKTEILILSTAIVPQKTKFTIGGVARQEHAFLQQTYSRRFRGAKPGFVFKSDDQGLRQRCEKGGKYPKYEKLQINKLNTFEVLESSTELGYYRDWRSVSPGIANECLIFVEQEVLALLCK